MGVCYAPKAVWEGSTHNSCLLGFYPSKRTRRGPRDFHHMPYHMIHKAAEQPVPGIRGLLEGSGQVCPSTRVGPGPGLEQGPADRPHLLMMPFIWMSLSSCCRRSRSSPSSSRAWYSSTSFWVVCTLEGICPVPPVIHTHPLMPSPSPQRRVS